MFAGAHQHHERHSNGLPAMHANNNGSEQVVPSKNCRAFLARSFFTCFTANLRHAGTGRLSLNFARGCGQVELAKAPRATTTRQGTCAQPLQTLSHFRRPKDHPSAFFPPCLHQMQGAETMQSQVLKALTNFSLTCHHDKRPCCTHLLAES